MDSNQLKQRSYQFALKIILYLRNLDGNERIKDQLLRSSTSVAANYRACCKARSRADFISKMGIVEEESDESEYWLELLRDLYPQDRETLDVMLQEASELSRIFSASRITAKKGLS